MNAIVDPGSFVWGFATGAAFTFVGVLTWALAASAKMGDRAAVVVATLDQPSRSVTVGDISSTLDAEARQYEQAESMGRDLPPAA